MGITTPVGEWDSSLKEGGLIEVLFIIKDNNTDICAKSTSQKVEFLIVKNRNHFRCLTVGGWLHKLYSLRIFFSH